MCSTLGVQRGLQWLSLHCVDIAKKPLFHPKRAEGEIQGAEDEDYHSSHTCHDIRLKAK